MVMVIRGNCFFNTGLFFTVVMLALRAAILAVDHVMAGRSGSSTTREAPLRETITGEGAHTCGRAFVIGRPPGHHAGPHGYDRDIITVFNVSFFLSSFYLFFSSLPAKYF